MIQKRIIYIILFSFYFLGCSKKKDSCIEIYLLKERISSFEGKSIFDFEEGRFDLDRILSSANFKYDSLLRYDEKLQEFIYAGAFYTTDSLLNEEPLITDDEIIALDKENSSIIFSESAAKKITKIKPHIGSGVQFAITENKKVILTGYFWSKYAAYSSTWYSITHDHTKEVYTNRNSFYIFKGGGLYPCRIKDINTPDLKEIEKLKQVFLKTDRLLNHGKHTP